MYNIIFRTDESETIRNLDVDLIKYKDFLIWPQAYSKVDQTRGQLGCGFIRIFFVAQTEHYREIIQSLVLNRQKDILESSLSIHPNVNW